MSLVFISDKHKLRQKTKQRNAMKYATYKHKHNISTICCGRIKPNSKENSPEG